MKIGDLYRCTWHTRASPSPIRNDCTDQLCLYVGEDEINRADGVKIVNHIFLVSGVLRIVDKTFLKYMNQI